MSDGHGWCRDVRRDEQVRAAEDAAAEWRLLRLGEVVLAEDEFQTEDWPWQRWRAVPAVCVGSVIEDQSLPHRRRIDRPIQHRDLPEVVAELRERVARLEAAQATIGTGDEIARLTAERDAARAESDRLRAAGDAMAEALTWDQSCAYDAATTRGAIRQRIAAWSEARACVAELERDRRPATWQEEEAAVEGAWLLCGLEPDWPSDEPGTIVRHAESMRREVGRLRARVAELEGAAAPAANAGGEPQPPRGWLTKEDCEALYLANAVLHGVFVGSWREKHDAAKRLEAIRVRALSEAGGEVE